MVRDVLVLCTRNRPDEVRTCLDTVRGQTRVPTRVLVVDSSDDDATERVVADFRARWPTGSEIDHLRAEPGLTRQRLAGIDATEEEIVHFVDDDSVLEPDYIDAIVDDVRERSGRDARRCRRFRHRTSRRTASAASTRGSGSTAAAEGVVLPSGRNVRVYTEPARADRRRLVAGLRDVVSPFGVRDRTSQPRCRSRPQRRGRRALVPRPPALASRRRSARAPRASRVAASAGAARGELVRVELVSRYERVRAGTGRLSRRAFWVSAFGQLFWYGAKGLVTLSGERLAIAGQTAAGHRRASRRQCHDLPAVGATCRLIASSVARAPRRRWGSCPARCRRGRARRLRRRARPRSAPPPPIDSTARAHRGVGVSAKPNSRTAASVASSAATRPRLAGARPIVRRPSRIRCTSSSSVSGNESTASSRMRPVDGGPRPAAAVADAARRRLGAAVVRSTAVGRARRADVRVGSGLTPPHDLDRDRAIGVAGRDARRRQRQRRLAGRSRARRGAG